MSYAQQKLKPILRWEWDRALVYGLLTALRGVAVGPVTAILIMSCLTEETQGYYYYFRSLLGLSVAAEFGMTGMVVPMVAHEWTRLEWEPGQPPRGSQDALSRWAGLVRAIFLFYAVVGPILAGVLFLFARRNLAGHSSIWLSPWLWTCLLTALEFGLRPILNVLEGCQQVAPAFRNRLWQGLVTSMALWCVLAAGGGLWCLPVSVFVTALLGLWPAIEFRSIFRAFLRRPDGSRIRWGLEVWPMQWRLGLAALVCNTASSMVVPIVLGICGPEQAGKFGLTLVLGQLIYMVSAIWMQTKAARLARLVALGESGELHRLLYQTLFIGLLAGILAAAAVECGLYGMHHLHIKYYGRMLPELPSAILFAAALLNSSYAPVAVYLRAHRFEPFLGTSLLTAGANLALTWLLTSRYGIMGACLAQLLAALVILPPTFLIWFRFRRSRYHTAPPAILDQE